MTPSAIAWATAGRSSDSGTESSRSIARWVWRWAARARAAAALRYVDTVTSATGPRPSATRTWPSSPGTVHAWPGLPSNPWARRNVASTPAGTSPASIPSANTPIPTASTAGRRPESSGSGARARMSSMAIDMPRTLRVTGTPRGARAADDRRRWSARQLVLDRRPVGDDRGDQVADQRLVVRMVAVGDVVVGGGEVGHHHVVPTRRVDARVEAVPVVLGPQGPGGGGHAGEPAGQRPALLVGGVVGEAEHHHVAEGHRSSPSCRVGVGPVGAVTAGPGRRRRRRAPPRPRRSGRAPSTGTPRAHRNRPDRPPGRRARPTQPRRGRRRRATAGGRWRGALAGPS